MAERIILVPVFIGSPGGLEKERRAARGIVEELNRDHSRHWGCMLELVGWEETLPGHGRPQELINKDLDRCEYFIGVLHDHWGSPSSSGNGGYTSGFEEEFERAKAQVEAGEMKDMAVFFKELSADRKRDPGPSLTKVLNFRDACFKRKDALYADFSDLAAFESLVRAKLSAIGWAESQKKWANTDSRSQAEQPRKQDEKASSERGEASTLLAASTEAFLREMVARTSEWEETSSVDVARMRLIGTSISRSGNDDIVLGNHDANILFIQRDEIELSNDEVHALVSCGIEGFRHQNVPLWHWLSKEFRRSQSKNRLRVEAVLGKERRQRNAIKLLMLLGEVPDFSALSRKQALEIWMDEGVDSEVFKAANMYLRKLGITDDVPILEDFYKENTSSRKNEIGETIISIEARLGELHALNRILQLEVEQVGSKLCAQLFAKPSSFTTELLTQCLQSASGSVRRHAMSELNERKADAPAVVNSLLSDPDYGVRYCAAEALHMAGRTLDESVAKAALTVVSSRSPRSLFAQTETDSHYFDLYRTNRLAELTVNELRSIVDQGELFNDEEAHVMFLKHTRKVKAELLANLKDGFIGYFEQRIGKLKAELGQDSKTVLDADKLVPFLRRRMLATGVEALSGLKDKNSLPLLRRIIDEHGVEVSIPLLEFLGRYGEWDDLDRICKLGDFSTRRYNTLLASKPSLLPQKAIAMVAISRGRIADLLAKNIPVGLRKEILLALQKNILMKINNEAILAELNHEDDECRAILALKCCEHFSKKRISELLMRYTNHDEHRYYNCIHWLDMGVSMPRAVARSIAKEELALRS